jgi:hypothetical protein
MRRLVRLAVLSLYGIAGAISLAHAQTLPGVPLDPEGVGTPATAPLYLIFEQGHWGLIDARGNVVLPARYDQVAGHPYGWNPGSATPPGVAAQVPEWNESFGVPFLRNARGGRLMRRAVGTGRSARQLPARTVLG